MITNLVATITVALATNVTETFPQHLVTDPAPAGEVQLAVFRGHWENVENPREKWITTNVVERHSASFIFEGGYREVVSEWPLTNWTTHFEKLDGWTRSATNSLPPAPAFSYR